MQKFRIWLGNGDHPDIESPQAEQNPGCVALFPTEAAEEMAPKGAQFVAAVATSPRPGSDTRDGFFVGRSPNEAWKWVLWSFTYDDNCECWEWVVRATSDQQFKDAATAAAHLLTAVWTWQRDNWDKTLFEQVEDTGLLSEQEIWEIGRKAFNKQSTCLRSSGGIQSDYFIKNDISFFPFSERSIILLTFPVLDKVNNVQAEKAADAKPSSWFATKLIILFAHCLAPLDRSTQETILYKRSLIFGCREVSEEGPLIVTQLASSLI